MAAYGKESEIAEKEIRDFGRLRSLRGNFEGHWREIAERVIPMDFPLFQQSGYAGTKGDKRTQELYDSSPLIALGRFTSILDSMLTPRNQMWHKLKSSNSALNRMRDVKLWFEEATDVLFKLRYSALANFSSQNIQVYQSLGGYGTGALFTDTLRDRISGSRGFRYRFIHLGELFIRENHQGIVDSVYRYFSLTVRQAYQMWGNRLPEGFIKKLDTDPDCEYFFLHCVKPRENYDPNRLDIKGMPYASYYICEEGKVLLEEGGYRSFPYSVPRYIQSSGEPYGRSVMMDALPAIKTLNEEKKAVLRQGQKAVDPALLAYDDGVMDAISVKAGHVNWGGVTADGRPLVHALPVGNIAIGKDLMDDERAVINDACLVSLFQILVETPQATATEVLERAREKGILIAPTLGRLQSEYLGSLIPREVDLAFELGLMPPMPQALIDAQGEYEIEYDSPLSRAQKAEESSGLVRTVESVLNIVNVTQNPEPLDFFNWDLIVPEMAANQGVPVRWTKSLQQVLAIRQNRAEQAQTQQAIQAAPSAAALIKAGAVASKAG